MFDLGRGRRWGMGAAVVLLVAVGAVWLLRVDEPEASGAGAVVVPAEQATSALPVAELPTLPAPKLASGATHEPLPPAVQAPNLTVRWDEQPTAPLRAHLQLDLALDEMQVQLDPTLDEPKRLPAGERVVWSGAIGEAQVARWTLWLDEQRIGAGSVSLVQGENDLQLVRGRWPSLTLIARDAQGLPIEKASLTLWMSVENQQGALEAVADAGGQADFAPIPAHCIFSGRARAEGFVDAMCNAIVFSPTVHEHTETLALAPLAKLTGAVRDADEKPVAGCKLELRTQAGMLDGKTDGQGRFAFDACAGTAEIKTRSKSHPDVMQRLEIAPSGSDIVLRLPQPGFVEGTVLDPRGEPAAGQWLHGSVIADGPTKVAVATRTAETDASGHFRLGPFGDERVEIMVIPIGVSASGRPGEPCLIQLPEKSVSEIEFKVRDRTTGQPLTGRIQVSVMSGATRGGFEPLSIKAGGAVTAKAMLTTGAPGSITVSKEGYAPLELELPAAPTAAPIEIALEASETMHFDCVSADGAPLAGAVLTLRWPSGEELVGVKPEGVMTQTAVSVDGVGSNLMHVASEKGGTVPMSVILPTSTTFEASKSGFYPSLGPLFSNSGAAAKVTLIPFPAQ